MSIDDARVPFEMLARRCDPDELGFETTDELPPLEGTIGQERAISALELGLDIEEPGSTSSSPAPPARGATPQFAPTSTSSPRTGPCHRIGVASATSKTRRSPSP